MAALVPSPQAVASSRNRRGKEYLLWYNSFIITTVVVSAAAVVSPFAQDEWPNPARKKQAQQPLNPPNLLLTTLAPEEVEEVIQPPFSQNEWLNPIRKAIQDYSFYRSPFEIPQVPTTDAFGTPFTQTEHPNPGIHPDTKVSLLWFNSAILPQTDQAQGAFGTPFYQTEHPNPNLRGPFRDLTWTQTPLVSVTEFEVVESPFSQIDWPNPLRARWVDGTWTQTPLEIPQFREAQNPFSPPEIQNPVLRTVIRDFTWVHNNLENVFAPILVSDVKPFYQTNWPNPQIHPDTRVSLLWFNSAILPRTDRPAPSPGAFGVPFFETEWPNPINLRPKWRDRTHTQSPFEITPSGPESQDATTGRYVFREALVSPPIRRIEEKEWGWVQGSNLALEVPQAPEPLPPFSLSDWPNPLRPWIRDLTWTQTPFEILQVIPGPMPFSQSDWPNPEDFRPLWRDLTWTQTPNQDEITDSSVLVQNPFAQVEWPNPRSLRVQDVFIPQPYIETLIPVEVVVVPPTPEPSATRPSGGHHPWFKKIKRRLQPWEIEDIQRVINEIALRQVKTLELDQQKRFEELSRELQLKEIEWDATYLEILNDEREKLIHEEIGRLLRKKLREEEEEIFLLLAASL